MTDDLAHEEPDGSPLLIRPPLVLDCGSELLFFETVARLEAWVEAIDVSNAECRRCWDAEGRLLELRVQRDTATLLSVFRFDRDRVVVVSREDAPQHLPELHQALVRFLAVTLKAEDKMPTSGDTRDLLDVAIEYVGWA